MTADAYLPLWSSPHWLPWKTPEEFRAHMDGACAGKYFRLREIEETRRTMTDDTPKLGSDDDAVQFSCSDYYTVPNESLDEPPDPTARRRSITTEIECGDLLCGQCAFRSRWLVLGLPPQGDDGWQDKCWAFDCRDITDGKRLAICIECEVIK